MSDVSKQYQIITVEGKDQHYIRIIAEPFKDIIYRYGRTEFEEPVPPAQELKIKFEWFVEQNPYTVDELDKNALETLVGRITIHLFADVIKHDKLKENLT